jgi:hypothetical protein
VVEVARRLGVNARTLQWWRWRIERERSPEPVGFVPIAEARAVGPVSTTSVEVEVSGVRFRVEPGTDVQYVAALVAAVRAAC